MAFGWIFSLFSTGFSLSDAAVYLTSSLVHFACFHQLNIYCTFIHVALKKSGSKCSSTSYYSDTFQCRNVVLLKLHLTRLQHFPAPTHRSGKNVLDWTVECRKISDRSATNERA